MSRNTVSLALSTKQVKKIQRPKSFHFLQYQNAIVFLIQTCNFDFFWHTFLDLLYSTFSRSRCSRPEVICKKGVLVKMRKIKRMILFLCSFKMASFLSRALRSDSTKLLRYVTAHVHMFCGKDPFQDETYEEVLLKFKRHY